VNLLLISWLMVNCGLVLMVAFLWCIIILYRPKLSQFFDNGRFWAIHIGAVFMTYITYRPDVHEALTRILLN